MLQTLSGPYTLIAFPSVPGEMTRTELSSQNNATQTHSWIHQLEITTGSHNTDKDKHCFLMPPAQKQTKTVLSVEDKMVYLTGLPSLPSKTTRNALA